MKPLQAKNILFCVLFFLPTLTFAGEIFGTLKKDGKAVAQQEVNITQNGKVIGTATTDANGYFAIVIKPVGKCSIELPGYPGASFEVFSTNNSTGYTLTLVKAGDAWQLRKQ